MDEPLFGVRNRRRSALRAVACLILASVGVALWREFGFNAFHGVLFALVALPLAHLEFAALQRPRAALRDGLLGVGVWLLALIGFGGAYFQAPYTESLLGGGTIAQAMASASETLDLMLTPDPDSVGGRSVVLVVLPGLFMIAALSGALAFLLRLRAFKSLPLPCLVCGAAMTTLYPIGREIDSPQTWLVFFAGYSLVASLGALIGALGVLCVYWGVDRIIRPASSGPGEAASEEDLATPENPSPLRDEPEP